MLSDTSILFKLIALFSLLLFSSLFSGTEAAFFSLSRLHIQKIRQDKRLKNVSNLLERPRDILITILLGNEIVNVLSASLVAIIVYSLMPETSWLLISLVSIATFTPILLLVGEITPKILAIQHPLFFMRNVARAISIINNLFYPFRFLLGSFSEKIISGKMVKELSLMEDEFREIVDMVKDEGVLLESERELIHNVFDFGDLLCEDIMTSRTDIFTLPITISIDEILNRVKEQNYARIPIYRDSRDNIVGILLAKDLIGIKRDPELQKYFDLEKILRKPFFVPVTKKAGELFKELKVKKQHSAIVVDEYGGVAGIITMEDLLEELFGEIRDDLEPAESQYEKISPDRFKVSAKMNIELFNNLFASKLEDENYNTIGGHLLNVLGRIPKRGDSIAKHGLSLTVEKVLGAKILEIFVDVTRERDE